MRSDAPLGEVHGGGGSRRTPAAFPATRAGGHSATVRQGFVSCHRIKIEGERERTLTGWPEYRP